VICQVQSPCQQLDKNATVVELIDKNIGGWNHFLIQSIFWREEVEEICNLPLSRYSQSDKLIWQRTFTGVLMVRSTYFLDKERKSIQSN
jgi:hypothetical protein